MIDINEVELFIKAFKKGFNEDALEEAFTRGNCYHFALMLEKLFPKGCIVLDVIENHFMFCLDKEYYDITGRVYPNKNSLYSLSYIKRNDASFYNRLVRDCVYKIER